ncbi:MAG: protein kinase [Polyangiaceae bacterium]|nr:protein kinase [Polyangiaceae bacterium]
MKGQSTEPEFARSGQAARADPVDVDTGDRVGQVLGGRYELLRLVGTGGMGSVYEARHRDIHRRFAVKLLHTRHARSPFGVMRFKREARVAAALDSKYVVSMVDWGEADDGTPFLVMEYLQGMSLRALLRREGQLAPVRAVNLVLDACLGTAVAHEAGVIHRDLKPENLFVTRGRSGEERVKVLDYGVAKLVGAAGGDLSTRSGQAIGTPSYMPPEQATDAATVDRSVDIYALGVILFEALCGARPPEGLDEPSSGPSERRSVAVDLAERLPDAPEGLRAVVCKTLSLRPEDRFDSADELARALAPFAGRRGAQDPALRSGSTGHAEITLSDLPSRPSPGRGAATSPRRRLWFWAALGTAFAVGVAMFVVVTHTVERVPSGAPQDHSSTRPWGQEQRAAQAVASETGVSPPLVARSPVGALSGAATSSPSSAFASRPTNPSRAGTPPGPVVTRASSGAVRSVKESAPARAPSTARKRASTSSPTGFDPESPYANP